MIYTAENSSRGDHAIGEADEEFSILAYYARAR